MLNNVAISPVQSNLNQVFGINVDSIFFLLIMYLGEQRDYFFFLTSVICAYACTFSFECQIILYNNCLFKKKYKIK